MRRTLRRCVAVPPAGYHSRPGYLQYKLRRGMAHPPAAIRAGDADDPSALALRQAEPVRAALTTFADEEVHAAAFDAVVPVGQTSVEEFPRPVSDARRHLGDDDDDDVFVEDPEMDSRLQKDSAGTTCAVPKDAMDIVTDEFAKIREREKERRRRILNELANPDPMDYRYDGKLVPVPPINFGQLSPEAYNLGQSMFVGHNYSLVRQAKQSDYFFEINDLYVEIVFVGRANAGKSSLINALSQQGMAKTSSLPNSTRTANFYQSTTPEELSRFAGRNPSKLVKLPAGGLQFTLVDLPGFGIEGMSDKWRDNAIAVTDAYLGVRRSVNTVFMCIDADRGLTPTDLKYFDWLANVQGVFWILITQCDKVPHSRVCNVMSQVYKALTENRKKYRKAYPFVLPVSAHTGANIDTLRALIVETSGVIPGSKLRDILRRRSHESLQRLAEEERLRKANINHLPALEAGDVAEAESMLSVEEGPPSPPPEPAPRRTVELHLPAGESNIIRTNDLKLNLGLQRRDFLELDLDDTPHPPPASVAMAGAGTADLSQPTGVVSDFLEEVAAQETAADEIPRHRHSAERQVITASKAKGPRVAVEQPDGRFEETVGGHRIPGHTVRVGEMKNRRNAWKARQKLTDAQRAAPSAPWSQPTTPLSKSESKAYHRNNGRVMSMSDFEDFSSVTQSDNETRLTPTEFSKRQLEHNHSTRVSGGALPQGLLKKYGSQKPTPSRVLGL